MVTRVATPFGEFTKRCTHGQILPMGIQDVRRQRLRRYIEERYGGNVTRFATAVDRAPHFFNDLFRSRKKFGEKLARSLEERIGLPPYYLDAIDQQVRDAQPQQVPSTPSEAELDRAWKTYPHEIKARLVSLVETVRQSIPAEANHPQNISQSAANLRRRRVESRRARGGKEDAG